MISLQNETGEPMPEHSKSITLRIKLSTGEVIEGVNLHWDEFSTSTLYGYSYSILIKKEYVGKLIGIEFDPPPYRISVRKSSRYLPALERRAW